jgi:hypothetical protein
VTRRDKDLRRILDGRNDSNIDFALLVTVLKRLGYDVRTEGSHRTVTKPTVPEAMVIQPRGKLAKDYQVRQVRRVILKYESLETDE